MIVYTFESNCSKCDNYDTTISLYFRYADRWLIRGYLNDVPVLLIATSLDFLFQFLKDLIVRMELVHIVVREGKLGLEIAIKVEHKDY